MLYISWQPPGVAMRNVSDDAFYYMKIANNVALGKGSTFDGITPTNGYHPLWMLAIIPIYLVAPNSPGLAMSLCSTLQVCLYAAALIVLYKILKESYAKSAVLIGLLVLLNPWMFRVWIYGVEGSLHLLMLVLVLSHFLSNRDEITSGRQRRPRIILGLLLGLLFLVRIDSALMALSVGVTVLVANLKQLSSKKSVLAFLKRAALIVGPFAAVITPYLIWNLVRFGHLMTVSGTIKSTENPLSFGTFSAALSKIVYAKRNIPAVNSNTVSLVLLAAFICLIVYVMRSRSGALTQARRKLYQFDFFFLYVLLHLLTNLLLLKVMLRYWYVVPECVLCAILLVGAAEFLLSRIPSSVRLASNLVVAAIVLAAFACIGWKRHYKRFGPDNGHPAAHYKAAMWLKENTEPSAIIGCWDAGAVGYFSRRSVVNLDGLVNSFDYLPYLKKGNITEYLKEKKVSIIAQYFWDKNSLADGTFNSHKYRAMAGSLGEVLYHLEFRDSAEGKGHFYIWQCVSR